MSGANITIYNDNAEQYSQVQSDSDGFVSLEIPPLQTFFAVLSAEDFIPTSFTGYAGDGLFEVPEGTLYLRSEIEITDVADQFSSCESSSLPSIDGVMRLEIPQQDPQTLPLLSKVLVQAVSSENEEIDPCYAGESNVEEGTDESGAFAFFNLSEGLYTIKAKLNNEQSIEMEIEYPVYLPDEGNMPLYPLFFPLP